MIISNWRRISFLAIGLIGLAASVTWWTARAEERPGVSTAVGTTPGEAPATALSGEARIREALDHRVSLDFKQTPLTEVIEYLKNAHHIEIQIDTKALEEASIGVDAPVTCHISDVSLRLALRHILRPLDLVDEFEDEILVITTPDKAFSHLKSEVYSVEDLVHYATTSGEQETDYEPLQSVVTGTIAPQSWDDVGGPGSISAIQGKLVVTQTPGVQEEIQHLLDALRRVRNGQNARPSLAAIALGREEDFQAEAAVRRALSKPIDVKFSEAPLTDVISYFTEKLGIQVLLDDKALEEASIGSDVPVTRTLNGVSGRSTLKLILGALDLTYEIDGNVLLVTTPDKSGNRLRTVVYPVNDLIEIGKQDCNGDAEIAHQNLIETIVTTVAPPAWDEVGGPGSIVPFSGIQSIVVMQSQEVHERLAELLGKLRDSHQQKAIQAKVADPLPLAQASVRFYPVADRDNATYNADLAKSILETVAPKCWKEGETFIRQAPGGILVRQTPGVHRQIKKLLGEMRCASPVAQGAGGMGGGFF